MSRNKLIKFVNEYTGKTYAECRRICKLGHWNEKDVLLYLCVEPELLKTITKSAENLGEAFNNFTAAILDVGAKTAEVLADTFENLAVSMRKSSERMRAAADDHKKELNGLKIKQTFADDFTENFDVNKDAFNYEETITASILNSSEVRENIIKEDMKTAETILNDANTPVFAPYYARAIPNGKLYQNDGGRVTSEI